MVSSLATAHRVQLTASSLLATSFWLQLQSSGQSLKGKPTAIGERPSWVVRQRGPHDLIPPPSTHHPQPSALLQREQPNGVVRQQGREPVPCTHAHMVSQSGQTCQRKGWSSLVKPRQGWSRVERPTARLLPFTGSPRSFSPKSAQRPSVKTASPPFAGGGLVSGIHWHPAGDRPTLATVLLTGMRPHLALAP